MKPSVGRIVLVKLDEQTSAAMSGNHSKEWGALDVAPAIIVRVWTDTCVNLKVFSDGFNDVWITSVSFDESENPLPRTWHWPPRV